jgi:hypothetical protein
VTPAAATARDAAAAAGRAGPGVPSLDLKPVRSYAEAAKSPVSACSQGGTDGGRTTPRRAAAPPGVFGFKEAHTSILQQHSHTGTSGFVLHQQTRWERFMWIG